MPVKKINTSITMSKSKKKRLRKKAKARLAGGVPKNVQQQREWNFLNGNTFSLFGKSRSQVPLTAPSAQAKLMMKRAAEIKTLSNGDVRVIHTEYITDLYPSFSFKTVPLTINPGSPLVFPWLYSVARRFESYKFRRLRFRYESESSTQVGGTVFLAIDFDVKSLPPTNKMAQMSYESAVRGPPWASFEYESLAHNLSKRSTYYVADGSYGGDTDPLLYDTGTLYASVQGQPTEQPALGELYVDYEVDLLTPKIAGNPVSPTWFVLGAFPNLLNNSTNQDLIGDLLGNNKTVIRGDTTMFEFNTLITGLTSGQAQTIRGFQSASPGSWMFYAGITTNSDFGTITDGGTTINDYAGNPTGTIVTNMNPTGLFLVTANGAVNAVSSYMVQFQNAGDTFGFYGITTNGTNSNVWAASAFRWSAYNPQLEQGIAQPGF